MSDSVRPHRRQRARLSRPWDSPDKNTGVGCRFLLQCMKVTSESEVAQLCLTLCDPVDCSLPGSSVYGIFQARVLKWGAIAFSKCPLELSKYACGGPWGQMWFWNSKFFGFCFKGQYIYNKKLSVGSGTTYNQRQYFCSKNV